MPHPPTVNGTGPTATPAEVASIEYRPLVYIAGPLRGQVGDDQLVNIRNACLAWDTLVSTALVIAYCPHWNALQHLILPREFDGGGGWWEQDVAMLRRCEAVWRLKGASDGADREVRFAHALGLPVFKHTQLADLEAWARRRIAEVERRGT